MSALRRSMRCQRTLDPVVIKRVRHVLKGENARTVEAASAGER